MDQKRLIQEIQEGQTVLGIELGSTRIKAILINSENEVIAQGGHDWENTLLDGIWTYSLDDVWKGISSCFAELKAEVKGKYGVILKRTKAMGVSAMMHGYLAFDKEGELLVPFRTWRNTMTSAAAEQLSELFDYPVPERWSISHLYQAILNQESHVKKLGFLTTLAGYVHYKLTGKKVLGIGDASGMFPVDTEAQCYDRSMLAKFAEKVAPYKYAWNLEELLPSFLNAGEAAGTLTKEGAQWLDPSGEFETGIPLCPPEGDAGTGLVATNSVA